MSKDLPWYKRCPEDWRSGTRRHGMSFELRGFYSECLDAMWDIQGQLPKDSKKLSMMLASNPRQVRALMGKLVALGKIIETRIGYYNPRMMADILGLEELEMTVDLEPIEAPTTVESPSNEAPIAVESRSKVEKNPTNTTREVEADSEPEKRGSARARSNSEFWTAELNPSAAGHGSVALEPNGSIRLMNGTRQKWVSQFGSVERLDLALAQAAAYIEPNSSKPLLVRVEAQLARQLADRADRDRRYQAAKKPEPDVKPKRTMMDVLRERANAAI